MYFVDSIKAEQGEQELAFGELGRMESGALFVAAPGRRFKTDELVCAKRSMEYAVFHGRDEAPLSKRYECGPAAYDRWIQWLRMKDVDSHGNAYNARVLLDAKTAASEYLRSLSHLFEADDAELIQEAATHYERAADSLLLLTGAFPFPGDDQQLKDDVMLQKGIGWLAHARGEEEKAIDFLSKVNTKWK